MKNVEPNPSQLSFVEVKEKIEKPNKKHSYMTERGLMSYSFYFGKEFQKELLRLDETSHWIDMGAGEGIAIEEYRQGVSSAKIIEEERSRRIGAFAEKKSDCGFCKTSIQKKSDQKARVTGVTLKMRRSYPEDDRAKIFKGRYLESIPDKEFDKADLITDVFGVFSYTKTPMVVLEKYWNLLNAGGKIYIHFGSKSNGMIIDQKNERHLLIEWIENNTPFNVL